MSIEIKGSVTTIINTEKVDNEPDVLIWTISVSIEGASIDEALNKVYPRYYKGLENRKVTIFEKK